MQAAARSDCGVFWDWLTSNDAEFIASYRWMVEKELGVPDSVRQKDPHLYAVLEPSREENVLRIVYSVRSLEPQQFVAWCAKLREVLE